MQPSFEHKSCLKSRINEIGEYCENTIAVSWSVVIDWWRFIGEDGMIIAKMLPGW
jgi:hypothetical protein